MIDQLPRRLVLTAACALGAFLLSAGALFGGPVEAQLVSEGASIGPGRPFLVALHFRMAPDWHIYWKNPGDTGLPTTVSWSLPEGFSVGSLMWPAPQRFVSQGAASYGYEKEVFLLARVTPPAGKIAPADVAIRAHATWLACRIECTPGEADLVLHLPVTPGITPADSRWAASLREALRSVPPASGETKISGEVDNAKTPLAGATGPGFAIALVLAFLGGLILNLMPCVLPVISLKVLSFVRTSHDGTGSPLRHGLLFGAGVLVSFWAIVGILIALRAGGQLIGWGFQFQSPVVVAITAALFFLIGLNLLDVFELRLPVRSAGEARGARGGAGSFVNGLLATAVATPCTAPFMGGALGYALTQRPIVSFGVFTALAVGLAAPYVVLSAVPGLVKRIPRPGRWMVTLRQVLAFPMMGAVIWMLYVLNTLSGFSSILVLLSALLVAGIGAWIYGRWGSLERSPRSRVISAVLAMVLILGSTAYSAVRVGSAATPAREPASASSQWQAWSPQRVAELQAAGTPVFVDFSAKWCLTCQVNEAVALGNPDVEQAFREGGVATLKADWTDRNETIAKALTGFGRAGVPVYALYSGNSAQPVLLPELLTPGIVLEALRRLR